MHATKAHGTENDFVVVLDPDDQQPTLGHDLAAALCDRRAGIGADGFIRLVRRRRGDLSVWFMDHWNADGSTALMCGNGARVAAEVLSQAGYATTDFVDLDTRSGPRRVSRLGGGSWSLDMGLVRVGVLDGADGDAVPGDEVVDTLVAIDGPAPWPGLRVSVGNPHVVVAVTDVAELESLDLTRAPVLQPDPAAGANVEFVAVTGVDATGVGHLRMRVHERGVGETRSCGTGAVAAAAAAATWAGHGAPTEWVVDVPGGRLVIALGPTGTARLEGPAVVVAECHLDGDWQLTHQPASSDR